MKTEIARGWGVKFHGKPIPWFSEWKRDALGVNEGRPIRVVITEEAEYADAVYEAVDSTDDERYFPLGIFLTLDEARDAVLLTPPDDLPDDRDQNDDVCRVDVYERKFGMHGAGKRVFRVRWERTYDEAGDEYRWGKLS